jgi:hypothetical protein
MGFPLQPGLMEDAYRGYDVSASQYQDILTLRLQFYILHTNILTRSPRPLLGWIPAQVDPLAATCHQAQDLGRWPTRCTQAR